MSVDEWNATPAWITQIYIEGLEDQGIIGNKDSKRQSDGGTGKTPPPVDYAEDPLLPRGFKTRRAG